MFYYAGIKLLSTPNAVVFCRHFSPSLMLDKELTYALVKVWYITNYWCLFCWKFLLEKA